MHQNDQPVAHAELDWWRDYLAGAPTTLALPVDHPRPAQQGTAGATHVFRLPATTADGLGRLARQLRSSPFMVAMAAYATLINRVSGTDDVLIGTPVGGRTESELDPLIEFFVNTVPVRVDLSGATTFGELVQRCRCCHCPCPWLEETCCLAQVRRTCAIIGIKVRRNRMKSSHDSSKPANPSATSPANSPPQSERSREHGCP